MELLNKRLQLHLSMPIDIFSPKLAYLNGLGIKGFDYYEIVVLVELL